MHRVLHDPTCPVDDPVSTAGAFVVSIGPPDAVSDRGDHDAPTPASPTIGH